MVDALVLNVDRSWRNPNLLLWHGEVWLVDHGAALCFHHAWPTAAATATRPYPTAREHVTIASASGPCRRRRRTRAADHHCAPVRRGVLGPDQWLDDEVGFATPGTVRDAYVHQLSTRVTGRRSWLDSLEQATSGEVGNAAHL